MGVKKCSEKKSILNGNFEYSQPASEDSSLYVFVKKYRQLLLLNGIALLMLGLLFLNALFGGEEMQEGKRSGSLGGLAFFLVSMWGLPVINLILFVKHFSKDSGRLAAVYGLLAFVFFLLAWAMWSYGIGAFRKIGG